MNKHNSNSVYVKARRKVKQIKKLIKHFIAFIMINILIIGLNLLTMPQTLWFYYVSIPWIGVLIAHLLYVYDIDSLFFNRSWEQKNIQKYMQKELR